MSSKSLLVKSATAAAIGAGIALAVVPSASAAPAQIPGEGTYLVGYDIAPGTYVSYNSDWCYWARLSGTSGDFDEIIANDFQEDGTSYVTIYPSDRAFESSNCSVWSMVEPAPAPRPSTGSAGS